MWIHVDTCTVHTHMYSEYIVCVDVVYIHEANGWSYDSYITISLLEIFKPFYIVELSTCKYMLKLIGQNYIQF